MIDSNKKTLATLAAVQLGLALGAVPAWAEEAPAQADATLADEGSAATSQGEKVAQGWQELDGSWRYGDANGSWRTGWLSWGGSWFYMDQDGNMLTGWQTVEGTRYAFGTDGRLQTGWQKEGEGASALWHHYDAHGNVSTGWLAFNGAWYLMGDDGVMLTGWQTSDGQRYFLNQDGSMHAGWLQDGDKWYYLKGSGAMATGWVGVGNTWYLMGDDGVMRTGLVTQDSATYLLDSDGAMTRGWQTVEGKHLHFGADGALSTGLFVDGSTVYLCGEDGLPLPEGWQAYDRQWYYVRSDGACETGWTSIDGKRYHFSDSGVLSQGWQEIGGKWYFFDSNGAQVTGWLESRGKSYYLDAAKGGAMATGWIEADGVWRWLDESGALVKDAWIHDGWAWYHLDADGQYQTGWQTIDGQRYLFGAGGGAREGWTIDGDSWYYLDEYGAPQTGWLQLGWQWYYFEADGSMHEGWLVEGNKRWFFVPGQGHAVTMDRKEADGKTYVYGATTGDRQYGWVGVWQEGGQYKTCFCDPTTGVRTDGPRIIDGYAFTFDRNTGALQSQNRTLARFVDELVKICGDNSHGYDQAYRYNQYGDYDCSSLTIIALQKAGFKTGDAVYTGNMREEIVGADQFQWLWWDEVGREGLRVGDIMLNEYSHTNVYLGNGEVANASGNEWGGAVGGEPGDQTGRELLVRSYYYYGNGIDGVLRYVGREGA